MKTSSSSVLERLNWPLILGLAALALVRPLFSIVGLNDVLGIPGTPLILTAIITGAWVLTVGFSRVREPVVTLVAAGLIYGVLSIILGGILSPILSGEPQGPVATPIAIVPVLATNAIWGLAAGAIALLVQRARGFRPDAENQQV